MSSPLHVFASFSLCDSVLITLRLLSSVTWPGDHKRLVVRRSGHRRVFEHPFSQPEPVGVASPQSRARESRPRHPQGPLAEPERRHDGGPARLSRRVAPRRGHARLSVAELRGAGICWQRLQQTIATASPVDAVESPPPYKQPAGHRSADDENRLHQGEHKERADCERWWVKFNFRPSPLKVFSF